MSGKVPNLILKIIELSTIARVGLVASFVGLILGQTTDSKLPLVVAVVVILLSVALLRHFVPQISAEWSQVGNSKRRPDPIVIQNRVATVEFQFDIPDHYDELYMTFEIEPYDIDVTQSDPANFDLEKGITYHSPIGEVDLLLDLEMKPNLDSAGTVPLRINDKLNGRTVAEIQVSS